MSAWSNTDTNLSKPGFTKLGNRNLSNANTYGVSLLEMTQRANANSYNNSAAHMGWVRIQPQYTDSSGNIRRKAETLVVMSTPITGNANIALTGSANVTNGNVSITANITATLVAANTFALATANVQGLIAVNTAISIGNAAFIATAINSANVTLNVAPNFAVTGAKITLTGANVTVTGVGTRFNSELKVGDVIVVGNVGDTFQGLTRRVVSIASATSLTVNTAYTNVNTGLGLLVGDGAWFPLT